MGTNNIEQWLTRLREQAGIYTSWMQSPSELLRRALYGYGLNVEASEVVDGCYTSEGVQIRIVRDDIGGQWILSVRPCHKVGILPILAFPKVTGYNYNTTLLIERIKQAQDIIKDYSLEIPRK